MLKVCGIIPNKVLFVCGRDQLSYIRANTANVGDLAQVIMEIHR